MLNARHDQNLGSGITLELVSNQNPWRIAQTLEQLAEESFGRLSTAVPLHEDIQDMSVLIDCALEVMVLALGRQHHLVEVPFVSPSWLTSAQLIGKLLAKSQRPLPDRLPGKDDASACHQLLDIAKAQQERKVEPHHMAYDLARIAEAAVKSSVCHHAF
jgi:hypothetical protein